MNTNAQLVFAFIIAQELSSLDTTKPETVSEELFGQMTTLTSSFMQGPDLPELHDARHPKPQSTVRPDLEELGVQSWCSGPGMFQRPSLNNCRC